jgi:hypothetical protein
LAQDWPRIGPGRRWANGKPKKIELRRHQADRTRVSRPPRAIVLARPPSKNAKRYALADELDAKKHAKQPERR